MCPSVPWRFSSQVLELNSTPLEQKDSLDWMNPADEQNMGGMIMCDFWSESHSLVSNSLPPHGLYSPWNSPGQNTGEYRPFPSPGDLPNPGIEPRSPALQADSLTSEPLGQHTCVVVLTCASNNDVTVLAHLFSFYLSSSQTELQNPIINTHYKYTL